MSFGLFACAADLVVASAKATATCEANETVTATITATVTNQGQGTADLSKIPWHIILEAEALQFPAQDALEKPWPPLVKPQLGGPTTLKPGDSWTGTLTVAGLPRFKKAYESSNPGYAFLVRADPLQGVAESNEDNNTESTIVKGPCFAP